MNKKVAICGSMRVAKDVIEEVELKTMLNGDIPMPPCCMSIDIERKHGAGSRYKEMADMVHKLKISIADEVIVCNPNGYIGESTRSEMDYAISIGKKVILTH